MPFLAYSMWCLESINASNFRPFGVKLLADYKPLNDCTLGVGRTINTE